MIIYVLDDDPTELPLWHAASGDEHAVLQFTDALSFRQAMLNNPPDAVVLDLVMPNEPGTEVCKWVKACYPGMLIMICTGQEGQEFEILAQQCGALYQPKTVQHKIRLGALCHAN